MPDLADCAVDVSDLVFPAELDLSGLCAFPDAELVATVTAVIGLYGGIEWHGIRAGDGPGGCGFEFVFPGAPEGGVLLDMHHVAEDDASIVHLDGHGGIAGHEAGWNAALGQVGVEAPQVGLEAVLEVAACQQEMAIRCPVGVLAIGRPVVLKGGDNRPGGVRIFLTFPGGHVGGVCVRDFRQGDVAVGIRHGESQQGVHQFAADALIGQGLSGCCGVAWGFCCRLAIRRGDDALGKDAAGRQPDGHGKDMTEGTKENARQGRP